MKKLSLTFFLLIVLLNVNAQIVDIDYSRGQQGLTDDETKPQFLKNGFFDILSDGNVQASARLLRLNIGEPNKFYLPLFIYTGASGNTFGENKLNKTTVSNLLNPIGGTLNISFNGLQNLVSKSETSLTKLRFAYQFGGRLINGTDSLTNENLNFFNGQGNIGLFFQTGVWEPENTDNMGVFYVQLKATGSISSKENLQKLFGANNIENNFFYGYSLDAGIELNQVINVKLSVYQYLNNTNISLLKNPIVKFSLDYTLKK